MIISVFPPQRHGVPSFDTEFALKQDNWNDYDFYTLYHLYRRPADSKYGSSLIGPVKILKRGQKEFDQTQITQDFTALDSEFCSVGTSLDYYQRLSQIPPDDQEMILLALRDVVFEPELQAEFQNERGWAISLFRDNPDFDEFLTDAHATLTSDFSKLAEINKPIYFMPANWSMPLELQFEAPEPPSTFPPVQMSLLPRRINVVIGRNGTGKSTLLSRMARVAFAAPSDRSRQELENIGVFKPKTIGFIKIIAISYSPFDNFIVPGLHEAERLQISQDLETGTGRYVYVGIRDIAAEARVSIEKRDRHDDTGSLVASDRHNATRLKSIDQLTEEFEHLIDRITQNDDIQLFVDSLKPLLADASFSDIQDVEPMKLADSYLPSAFRNWSTGHKIALHIIASLVAHITRRSLVLFDEPEMHLHPPLIASLMRSFRNVLEKKNAFAVVATHSPVILQETLARHVHIIRRVGSDFQITKPLRETFGENVGVLTYDTFGLTANTTDFHRTLDRLVQVCANIDEINELFQDSLSGQALSYVMARFDQKTKK